MELHSENRLVCLKDHAVVHLEVLVEVEPGAVGGGVDVVFHVVAHLLSIVISGGGAFHVHEEGEVAAGMVLAFQNDLVRNQIGHRDLKGGTG